MKRLLVLTLGVLLLVLAGCGKQSVETPETTLQEAQPDPGWYIPDSEIEKQTGGAVRAYELCTTDQVIEVGGIGDKLLLKTQDTLTVLSGESCVFFAGVTDWAFDVSDLQRAGQGLAYYESDTNKVIFLDQHLQVISEIVLPEAIDSVPVVAPDGSEIYYCVGGDIKAFDINLNISRLVKNQLVESQELENISFGGRLLCCNVQLENGETGTVYLRTETGETVSTDEAICSLDTYDFNYVVLRNDGIVRQVICGAMDGEPSGLDISQDSGVIPAASLGGVVEYTTDENNTLCLNFYQCSSGSRIAQVSLPNIAAPVSCYANQWDRRIWFLAEDLSDGVQKLYSWDYSGSAITDETVYKATIYTLENPDTEGLEACEERVTALNKAYGVDIQIFEDAVKETGEHTVVPEHQTAVIHAVLDELESIFPEFPEKFLRRSATKPLRICIVRNVDGGTEGVQFYKKSYSYIFLSAGSDIRSELIRCLGYVVNSRVVSNTSLLDTWTTLNPEGFTYGEGKDAYLEGEDRAFADTDAMTSVVEDRSSIFRYAMEEGNEEMFSSETMQKKLKLLCEGIRKVWKWRKEEVSYPWEQYLNESLAYKK